ncbi:MAG: ABC transporter ATP-binding protein [Chloroflexi bacterium]|nr:ABC transporter ATP-binding protein [Chloroflexota bacterium]
MAGAAVEVNGVSRLFKLGAEEVWAVRDVTIAVQPGEFLALTGRSGSGKTTLLNLIAGLDRPTEGQILIDGARVDTMGEGDLNKLRRTKLGFIFQSFGLLPLLSAQENVELPLRIAGFRNAERSRRAREALSLVGLGRRAHHRPYELSGGEQQRVAIARAMATSPDLLLADEPTGELDSATATAVFDLLREIARGEGVTIITCTHDRLVMELADRVEELADGRLLSHEQQHIWGRHQESERGPFRAALPSTGEGAGLSSLVGADTSQFGPAALAAEREEAAKARPSEPAATSDPEETAESAGAGDDPARWARPR